MVINVRINVVVIVVLVKNGSNRVVILSVFGSRILAPKKQYLSSVLFNTKFSALPLLPSVSVLGFGSTSHLLRSTVDPQLFHPQRSSAQTLKYVLFKKTS